MSDFHYPEASAHGGHLRYRGSIPVLVVEGSPERTGRQIGALALRPALRVLDYPLDYVRSKLRAPLLPQLLWMLLRGPCRRLYSHVPSAYRAEIRAMAATCRTGGRLVPANTMFDLGHAGLRGLFGCSSLLVPPHRSATGGVLFGRNLDFFPLGYLHRYSLVTAYRPSPGRLGFASVGFPGVVGCFSAMNVAGVCVASHEVFAPNVRRTFDPGGVPFPSVLRGVMEECRSADEAVDRVRQTRFATTLIVVVADAERSRVVDVTPDGAFARGPASGLDGCSNHFLHPATRNPSQPDEYRTLGRLADLARFAEGAGPAVSVAEVWGPCVRSARAS